MLTICSSRITNKIDNECLTLYAEFTDSKVKVIILCSSKWNNVMLTGEMNTEDIEYYANGLNKSRAEYLTETREAFCGMNSDIRFEVDVPNKFKWSQKDIWTLGEISLSNVLNVDTLFEPLKNVLNAFQDQRIELESVKTIKEHLSKENAKLEIILEEVTKSKNCMEEDLHKKFLVVLNEKKRKIRELDSHPKQTENLNSVYDNSTDEQSSDEVADINPVAAEGMQSKKRKSESILARKTKDSSTLLKPRPSNKKSCNTQENPGPSLTKYSRDEVRGNFKIDTIAQEDKSFDKQNTSQGILLSGNFFNSIEEDPEEDLF